MAVSCAVRLAHQPTPVPPSCFPFQPMNIKTEMPTYDYVESSPAWALESKLSLFKRCKTDFNIPEESQLTSWTKKHPQHWTREEVLDWVYFVVDQLHLDGSLVRGEAYQTITGSRLCQMSRHDFHLTDPQYGTRLYDIFRDLLQDVDIQAPKPIEDDTAINFDCFAEHHNNSYNFPPRSWDRQNNNHNHNLSMAITLNPKSSSFFGNNDNKDSINTNIVVYGQDNDVKVDLRGLGVYSISTDIEFPSTHAAGQRSMPSSSSSSLSSSSSSSLSSQSTASAHLSMSSLNPVSTPSSSTYSSFLDAHPHVIPMSSPTAFPLSMDNKSHTSPSLSSMLSLPASLPTQLQQQHHHQLAAAAPQSLVKPSSSRSSTSPPQTSSPASSNAMASPSLPFTVTSLDSMSCSSVSSKPSSSSPSSSSSPPSSSLGSSFTSITFNVSSMTPGRRTHTPSHSSSSPPLTSSFSSMSRSSIISSTSSLGSTDLSSSTIGRMDVGDADYVSDDDLFVNPLSEDVEMSMEVTESFPEDLVMCSGEMGDSKRRKSKGGHSNKGTHLWEFVRDLLRDPIKNPKILKWEDKESGVFRFVQSEAVAQLWGEKKKNPMMTYEKLSRAMRFCRSIGYFNTVPKNGKFPKKLCFMFGDKARGWKD